MFEAGLAAKAVTLAGVWLWRQLAMWWRLH
jgi:hypothetical protein